MVEAALIGSLVVILSLEYFAAAWKNLAVAFKENPTGVVKYFGSAAVFWLAMACLPPLLLSIYMRHHRFFAFEAFEDSLSFQMLSLNVTFNLLMPTTILLLAILQTVRKWLKFATCIGYALLGFGLIFLATPFGLRAKIPMWIFYILFVAYFWIMVSWKFERKATLWWVPLTFACGFLCLPIVFPTWAAALVGNELYQMRVGAIDVEIVGEPWPSKPDEGTPARLILRTSEFYYLKLKDDPEKLVIVKADSVAIRYEPEQDYTEGDINKKN